jgi:AcrR family transcriptional regulator
MSKAERTKAFIIEKTAEIFNKKGYAGTSLTDLTEATGLTKGALYGNFANKDEIALAVFDHNTKLIRDLVFRTDSDKSPVQWLLNIPRFYKERFSVLAAKGGCPVLNTAVEADDNQPLLKKRVNQTIAAWKKAITNVIKQGIEKGEIKKGIDASKYAGLFLSMLEGAFMLSKSTGDLAYINDSMDRMKSIIVTELMK